MFCIETWACKVGHGATSLCKNQSLCSPTWTCSNSPSKQESPQKIPMPWFPAFKSKQKINSQNRGCQYGRDGPKSEAVGMVEMKASYQKIKKHGDELIDMGHLWIIYVSHLLWTIYSHVFTCINCLDFCSFRRRFPEKHQDHDDYFWSTEICFFPSPIAPRTQVTTNP